MIKTNSKMSRILVSLQQIASTRLFQAAVCIGVVVVASAIFALRVPLAFQQPNFYAEDGNMFFNNVLHKNPISAIFTWFDGYFIVGLYILCEIALFIVRVFGLHFYDLALVAAVVSCAFLGL